MAAPVQIDISDVIDKRRITSFQVGIFTLCTVCLLMDGFDWQALAYIAPAVVQDFQIPNSALGPVFGATNVGFLIGAVLFSMVADKIGRRPVLIGATLLSGAITLFTARATSVQELLMLRFVAGIGFGSIVPNVTTLVGEYSPQNMRITAIMIVTTLGLNGGAMICGFVSAWLIPTFGWASVFYVGGVVPLVIAVLIGINALAAISYPISVRSSGVGWGLGVGRMGAIVGPVLGGELMRLHWSTNQIFLAAVMPAAISTAAMFSMRWAIKPNLREGVP